MSGWASSIWWYFLPCQSSESRSMPYFGVRANSPLSLASQRLDHGARVVDAEADADRHQERQVLEPRLPRVREQLALADHVEVRHRERRREEQRHVDQHHLGPAHVVAHVHGREHEDRQHHHQQVVEVGGEVEERLGLDLERQVRLQDARQQLAAGLDRALRPAVLLRLEGVHLDRHFRRRDEVLHEHEPPAPELGAIAQVEILGQRVVLPAAGVGDDAGAPDAGRAVEVEEAAGAVAARRARGRSARRAGSTGSASAASSRG